MKTKLFLSLAAVALATVSCTSDGVLENEVTAKRAIGFGTYVNGTRADYASGDVTATEMQSADQGFGVVGYHNDGTNHNIYLGTTSAAVKQTYQTDKWDYVNEAGLQYWPASGTMDFYAYFPYNATVTVAGTNGSSTTPLTITSWTDGQDVLVASATGKSYEATTTLQFAHAFAKIKGVTLTKASDGLIKDLNVTISSVEFLNTATKGSIKVSETGTISYDGGNTARAKTLSSAVTASSTAAPLIENANNAYIFPAGTIWNGDKSSISSGKDLSNDGKVVMVLKGKVLNGSTYLVGDASNDGDIYIPLSTAPDTAGKRYTYNITMKDNVGYKVDGDKIFDKKPIKFTAEVNSWGDEDEVNITL